MFTAPAARRLLAASSRPSSSRARLRLPPKRLHSSSQLAQCRPGGRTPASVNGGSTNPTYKLCQLGSTLAAPRWQVVRSEEALDSRTAGFAADGRGADEHRG